MNQQTIDRKFAGVYTFPNKLTIPEGAAIVAQNCSNDRPGIISCRRGFNRFGAALDNAAPSAMFEYLFNLVFLDGTTLKYDDGTTRTAWTGSFSPPSGVKMRGIEVDQKFLFTTSKGPYINEFGSTTPRRSGIPPALDVRLAQFGVGDGWLIGDTQVGYRIVFGRGDLPPGAPSPMEIITNQKFSVYMEKTGTLVNVLQNHHGYTTGDIIYLSDLVDATYINGPQSITVVNPNVWSYTLSVAPTAASTTGFATKQTQVTLTASFPQEAGVIEWYEVYRTSPSASASTVPFDDCAKLVRVPTTFTDFFNGYVTFLDIYSDDFRGESLYTNETSEGIAASNDRPPFAKHMVSFRGHTIFGNIYREQKIAIQLTDLTSIVNGTDSITITLGGISGTFTFDATENVATGHFQRFNSHDVLKIGSDVRDTTKSLCHVINQTMTVWDTPLYAFYASGVTDEPGKIVIQTADLVETPFYLTATATASGKFSPVIPTSGTTLASSASIAKNRIAISKFEKPEACPVLNTLEAGPPGFDIVGMVATKESVLIFLTSGCYEMTGETDGLLGKTFSIREVDSTLALLNPETLVYLDNVAIGWFDAGICRVSSYGAAIISREIENVLAPVARRSNFTQSCFAVKYESAHKYILWFSDGSPDNKARIGYVYDVVNNTWVGPWKRTVTCGVSLGGGDDLIYLGDGDRPYVLQERKDFNENDFIDEDIRVSVYLIGTTVDSKGNTVTTAQIYYNFPDIGPDVTAGWMFQQGIYRVKINSANVNSPAVFDVVFDTLFPIIQFVDGTVSIPIDMEIQWADESAGNVGMLKQFSRVQIYQENNTATRHKLAFVSDVLGVETELQEIITVDVGGFGSDYYAVFGDPASNLSTPIKANVPRDHRRCRQLRMIYRHKRAREPVEILQMSLDYRAIGTATTRGAV